MHGLKLGFFFNLFHQSRPLFHLIFNEINTLTNILTKMNKYKQAYALTKFKLSLKIQLYETFIQKFTIYNIKEMTPQIYIDQ